MEKKIEINGENWTALKMQLSSVIMANIFTNKKLSKQFPRINTIYHYTSLSGLISIIESQTLFCTNINFLNDKKEFKHGVNIIEKVIEKLKKEKLEISILETIETNIEQIYKGERYVTCFSKDGDLLSQWRAYANQGKGVSIGFDFYNFEHCIEQIIHGKHIEYNEDIQNQVIEELVRIIIHFYKSKKEAIDWGDYGFEKLVTSVIFEFLQDIISSYKNSSFKEEQEFRYEYEIDGNMVKKKDEIISFRSSDTLIIPYIKLEAKYKRFLRNKEKGKYENVGAYPIDAIKKLPIKEIIIGPSLDYETIKIGIEELLLKHNYENIKIIKSEIPYRI